MGQVAEWSGKKSNNQKQMRSKGNRDTESVEQRYYSKK